MADDYPQVKAFRHPDAVHWFFWCPHCRRYHWHGAGPGHRAAHCDAGSPWRDHGYVLVDAGPASKEMVADAERKRPRGVTNNGV